MPKPTAILFDFGGTLDCPSHWLDRFLTHYRAAEFDITREELDPAFDFATKAGYAAGKAMERFKLGDLVRFLVGNQFEYLRAEGPDRFREALSKMDSRERFRNVERLRESFLRETTDGLARGRDIDSKRVRAFKPEPAIFHAALRALRTTPNETAMVGDSMNKDMAPAHRLGMRTVFLRAIGHEHEPAAPPAQSSNGMSKIVQSDYAIDSLEEILTLPW